MDFPLDIKMLRGLLKILAGYSGQPEADTSLSDGGEEWAAASV